MLLLNTILHTTSSALVGLHESNGRAPSVGNLRLSLMLLPCWEPVFLYSPQTRAQFIESDGKESSVYSDKPNRKWGWGVKGRRVLCC